MSGFSRSFEGLLLAHERRVQRGYGRADAVRRAALADEPVVTVRIVAMEDAIPKRTRPPVARLNKPAWWEDGD